MDSPLSMAEDNASVSKCAKLGFLIREDFLGYIREFGPCGRVVGRDLLVDDRVNERKRAIVALCHQHPVVVFSKPGCGFCARAHRLLRQHLPPEVNIVDTPSDDALSRQALKISLELSTITFPMIVIKGQYMGGSDDIDVFIREDQIALVDLTPTAPADGAVRDDVDVTIPHSAQLRARNAHPLLFQAPRSKSVCLFQLYVYGNVIRMISVVHVIAFVVACFSPLLVTQIIMWVLSVDLTLFVLFGSTPWAPLQTAVLFAGWPVKGGSATSIPYKAVFAFYIVSLCRNVLFCHDAKTCGKPVHFAGLIINSALLALFRF
eukprot:GEMP01018066.1.p1 GENE.GEMP01018066.1~~GEMP01018066.1.p1  ORF type:complete len:319 (+),score=64.29 GEMP01018066.1:107-1063(+)